MISSAATAKVCTVGDFAVGKTSTVARFVNNEFSDKYLTTVGVKIDTRAVQIGEPGGQLKLVIWDIAGTDSFSTLDQAYLRGAAGYLLVADGTRRDTLATALRLDEEARLALGDVPRVLLVNKSDLTDAWEVREGEAQRLHDEGLQCYVTSAKTGANVEEAMQWLAGAIARQRPSPA